MERYNLNLFRIIRIASNTTVREFASKIGFTASYVSTIENDKRSLTEQYVNQFLAVYHLTKEDFETINNFHKKNLENDYPIEKKYQLLLAACLGLLYSELRNDIEKLIRDAMKKIHDSNAVKGDFNILVLIDNIDEFIYQLSQNSNIVGFEKISDTPLSYSFVIDEIKMIISCLKKEEYCGKNLEQIKAQLYHESMTKNCNHIFIDDTFFTPITTLALCEILSVDKLIEPTLCSKNSSLLSLVMSELNCNSVCFSQDTKYSSIVDEIILKASGKIKKHQV